MICKCCGDVVKTLAGGEEDSGIKCTECGEIFCDNCYDTGLGDGCYCHGATLEDKANRKIDEVCLALERLKFPRGGKMCMRCGTTVVDGYCQDETCPFSDHLQSCLMGWRGHPEYDRGQNRKCTCSERESYRPTKYRK